MLLVGGGNDVIGFKPVQFFSLLCTALYLLPLSSLFMLADCTTNQHRALKYVRFQNVSFP